MVIKKTIGYVLSALGIFGIALTTFPGIKETIPILTTVSDTNILIISAVVLIVGILMVVKKGSNSKNKPKELPIFEGESVVGYRRK